MRSYQRAEKRSTQKEENWQLMRLQPQLPMEELVAGLRDDIEAFSAQVGLKIIQEVLEEEVSRKTGRGGIKRLIVTAVNPVTSSFPDAKCR